MMVLVHYYTVNDLIVYMSTIQKTRARVTSNKYLQHICISIFTEVVYTFISVVFNVFFKKKYLMDLNKRELQLKDLLFILTLFCIRNHLKKSAMVIFTRYMQKNYQPPHTHIAYYIPCSSFVSLLDFDSSHFIFLLPYNIQDIHLLSGQY